MGQPEEGRASIRSAQAERIVVSCGPFDAEPKTRPRHIEVGVVDRDEIVDRLVTAGLMRRHNVKGHADADAASSASVAAGAPLGRDPPEMALSRQYVRKK